MNPEFTVHTIFRNYLLLKVLRIYFESKLIIQKGRKTNGPFKSLLRTFEEMSVIILCYCVVLKCSCIRYILF
jgi:hypothetical protein